MFYLSVCAVVAYLAGSIGYMWLFSGFCGSDRIDLILFCPGRSSWRSVERGCFAFPVRRRWRLWYVLSCLKGIYFRILCIEDSYYSYREWSVWKASTNFHPMKFHEHVDTTYPKINYKLQLLTRQNTRDMAHTKTPNGSNSESRWGARDSVRIS